MKWLKVTWTGWIEGPKLVSSFHFSDLLLLWAFSGQFSGDLGLSNGNSRLGFVVGNGGSLLKAVAWSEMT